MIKASYPHGSSTVGRGNFRVSKMLPMEFFLKCTALTGSETHMQKEAFFEPVKLYVSLRKCASDPVVAVQFRKKLE